MFKPKVNSESELQSLNKIKHKHFCHFKLKKKINLKTLHVGQLLVTEKVGYVVWPAPYPTPHELQFKLCVPCFHEFEKL